MLVAAAVSVLVFKVWYPSPYASIAGGLSLFALLISVDVVVGPALTAVAASPGKRHTEFMRDLAVIVVLQLAALTYGVYSLALARPVAVVFEVDRMRVVTAADIEPELLRLAPPEMRALSWSGPRVLAVTKPTDPAQQLHSIDLALAGIDLGMNPRNWMPYETQKAAVWNASRPVSTLLAKYPEAEDEVARIATEAGQDPANLRFLPLQARHASWTAVLGPDAQILGHLPVDGFL